jgi:transcriptional regulator with XRE-family HTH domain
VNDRARNSPAAFGIAIREVRATQSLTMRELATRVGISAPYINEIEKGHSRPSLDIALRLCDALGLDPEVALQLLQYRVTIDPPSPAGGAASTTDSES